jgi:uncharacterized protein
MTSRLTVKVVPGSSQNIIVGLLGDVLKIRVQAPPEKGKANAAVLKLVSEFLGVAEKRLSIQTGHASPAKVVEVKGLSGDDLRRKLAELENSSIRTL